MIWYCHIGNPDKIFHVFIIINIMMFKKRFLLKHYLSKILQLKNPREL